MAVALHTPATRSNFTITKDTTATRPPALVPFDPAGVPAELTSGQRFAYCHPRWNATKGRYSKLPRNPATGALAEADDPTTTGTWAEACAKGGYPLRLLWRKDGYTALDLDDAIKADGTLHPWARKIVTRIATRWDITLSGTGLRGWVRGNLPDGAHGRNATLPGGGKLEINDHAKFMTLGGRHLAGTPETIADCAAEVHALYAELAPPAPGPPSTVDAPPTRAGAPSVPDIIEAARNGTYGNVFAALFDAGDWRGQGHPSQSEADRALCRHIGHYAGPDHDLIDAVFQQSALCRPKWLNRPSYRLATMIVALKNKNRYHEWGRPAPPPPADDTGPAAPAGPPQPLASRLRASHGETLRDLGKALVQAPRARQSVQTLVYIAVRDDAWRDFVAPATKEHFTYGPDEFERFVKAPPFAGLGTDLATIEGLCEGDPEALAAIRRATGRPPAPPSTVDGVAPPPCAAVERDRDQWRQRAEVAEAWRRAVHELMTVPGMTPVERIVAYGTINEEASARSRGYVGQHKPDMTTISATSIGETIGLSRQTVNRVLGVFDERGYLRVETLDGGKGRSKDTTVIRLPAQDLLDNLRLAPTWVRPDGTPHVGGNGDRCPKCQSTAQKTTRRRATTITTTVSCADCGTVLRNPHVQVIGKTTETVSYHDPEAAAEAWRARDAGDATPAPSTLDGGAAPPYAAYPGSVKVPSVRPVRGSAPAGPPAPAPTPLFAPAADPPDTVRCATPFCGGTFTPPPELPATTFCDGCRALGAGAGDVAAADD